MNSSWQSHSSLNRTINTVSLCACPQTLAHGITKAGVQTEMFDLLSVDPQV